MDAMIITSVALLVGLLFVFVTLTVLMVTLYKLGNVVEETTKTLKQFVDMTNVVSTSMGHFGQAMESSLTAVRTLEMKAEEAGRRTFRRPRTAADMAGEEEPEKPWAPSWNSP